MSSCVPVFHSRTRRACEERAFVLTAVAIASEIMPGPDGSGFLLAVAPAQAALANHHLWQYEQEQHRSPPVPPPPPRFAHAWVGSLVQALVLSLAMLAVVQGWGPPDLFVRGELDSVAVQQGQWWRATTALMLHLDIVHLVSNVGAGAIFGFLASRLLGAGTAWLVIVAAATLSNLVEGWLAGAHRAVGASTAVFATLGLLAAQALRGRRLARRGQGWARRWAPLLAGLAVLGWLGTSGEGTDLVAHALGFTVGALAGALAGIPAVQPRLARLPQWLAGLVVLAWLGLCWGLALAA